MRTLLIIFLFIPIGLFCQNSDKQISNTLHLFFKNKNTALYCHINKTKFIPGEEIWYSVYAFNKNKGKILLTNKNVKISLHKTNGLEVFKNLVYIKRGKTFGNILISKDIKPGFYYLKATLPQINNSEIDEAFYQKIEVINDKESIKNSTIKYDLQILPEGGQLISNVKNKCGFKIVNQSGKGVQMANLKLVDNKNNIVLNNISSNHLGMGSFIFNPKNKKNYFLTHSILKKVKLPKIHSNGINLSLKQNFSKGNVQITLSTNKESLKKILNKKVTIVIHKNSLSKFYTTSFKENIFDLKINIPNKELYSGVNTVTVFFNEKPILERLFFNYKSIPDFSSSIKFIKQEKDSTTLTILNKLNNNTISSNVSISVLASETIANSNRNNIYNSVFLAPFVKGIVEQPSYYFFNINNKKRYDLDLLLLNQGWRKYTWESIFDYQTSKENNIASNGLTIKGYIRKTNIKDSINQILLHSKKNKQFSISPLNENYRFNFKNLDLRLNSQISLSAINNKGQPVKANFFYVIEPNQYYFINKYKSPFKKEFSYTTQTLPFKVSNDTKVLEEVNIEANKLKFEKFTRGRFGVKIDSSLHSFTTIEDYFKFKERLTLRFIRGSSNIPPGYYWTYRDGQIARFIVNGRPATYMNGLLTYSMKNVLEVYFGGKDGFGRRMSHIIFTNGKELEIPKHLKTAKEFKLTTQGFNIQKKFYQPVFQILDDELFLKYGSFYWFPNLIIEKNKTNEFKIYNPYANYNLTFYIEGFTENGNPFSTIVQYKK